jgi:biopolymer transport protein ExbB
LTLLGGIAPLLGLLGTVTGMMQAFQQLSLSGGQASIAQLADGIWVAMITTAFGLAIAIPAHLAHSLFESALNARIGAMNGALQWLEERRSQAQ